MKLIFCVLLITVTASAIPIDNEKYELFHHIQHQSTVETARQRMSQKLSEIEGGGGQRVASGYNNYCGTCANGFSSGQSQSSRLSSSQLSAIQSSGSSANIVEGTDYLGVGYVGHASDHQDELQARVAPSAYSQSRFSSNANYEEEEEEDLQQRQVVPDINDIHSSAYRSSANNRDDVQGNLGYHDLSVSNDGKYESYSQRRKQQQQEESETSRTISQPKVYFVPAPITSSTSQRASEALNQQRVSMVVRPGTTTFLRVPVSVGVPDRAQQYNSRTSGTSGYHQASGAEIRPAYGTYYAPSNTYADRYAASGNQYDSTRTIVAQPEKYRTPDLSNYNKFTSRSQNDDVQESETYQTRVNPSTITDGGASRYLNSGSLSNVQQARVVQPFPVQSIESASLTAQRTAEEQRQRSYTPARPNYVHRAYANNEDNRSESSRTESSIIYTPIVSAPVSSSSQSRLSQAQQQQSQYNSRAGNAYSPYSPAYPTTSSRLGAGLTYTNSENLYDYMSESERLARLQQQQLASSSQSSSSQSASQLSIAEANRRTLEAARRLDSSAASFVDSSSNIASRNSDLDTESVGGSGPGGFQRVKSWQKQSKWESGSQYGTDGKPKSFSMLSTAESEKHNINGAEAGYAAATSTLENDGKVSTYSIHTP